MASNLFKICTAALAGSILGIAFERLPPASEWPTVFQTASAASAIITRRQADDLTPNTDDIHSAYKIPDVNPQLSATNLKHSAKFGLPSNDNLRLFNDYILSYDRRLRAAAWVIEHLTPEKLKVRDQARRDKSKFKEDEAIHEYFRATLADFHRSGFDRGHMAAAGNHKTGQDEMDQTFALSNISPQVPEFNQGAWERLEAYVRFRAARSKNTYVVSGPLYLPMKASDGNLYVTYRVLGKNHVSVPSHYFKVFLVETKDDKLELEAFMMPNDPKMDKNIKINNFRIPIDRLDTVERASGVIFFDQLPRSKLLAPLALADGFKDEPRDFSKKIRPPHS